MSTIDPGTSAPESPEEAAQSGTLIASLALKQRVGGIAVPAATVVVAFLMGGLVVLATGHNPLLAYRDIFNGAGLNWIFHPTTDTANNAAYNLSQTLLQTTTLILTGLAVAFAFRCGMFNIGGQGQYFVGLYVANWVGVSFAKMAPFPHVVLGIAAAAFAGAVWAGIAGFLKATVGAHEVISTIMLNWIAIWGGTYLFGVSDIPVSTVGFLGIAVALLGRNTAVGTGLAALLFGALLFGTTHGLQSSVIQPELAGNLTYMIQGLIVLFVGADILILYVWNARRRL